MLKRIQDGFDEGNKRYGSLKNDSGISKAERDVAIGLPVPSRAENDTVLGYDYGATTTTAVPGKSCPECGHTIGQVFAGVCDCACHAMENMACPICREEEGDALKSHLQRDHDMNAQDASVVAKDSETRRNAKKMAIMNSIDCPACGRAGDYREITNHLKVYHDLESDQLVNALDAARRMNFPELQDGDE